MEAKKIRWRTRGIIAHDTRIVRKTSAGVKAEKAA